MPKSCSRMFFGVIVLISFSVANGANVSIFSETGAEIIGCATSAECEDWTLELDKYPSFPTSKWSYSSDGASLTVENIESSSSGLRWNIVTLTREVPLLSDFEIRSTVSWDNPQNAINHFIEIYLFDEAGDEIARGAYIDKWPNDDGSPKWIPCSGSCPVIFGSASVLAAGSAELLILKAGDNFTFTFSPIAGGGVPAGETVTMVPPQPCCVGRPVGPVKEIELRFGHFDSSTDTIPFGTVSLDELTVEGTLGTDTDNDGVPDDDDLCPDSPAGPVDAVGCADSQVDFDGDGYCDLNAPSTGLAPCIGTDNCPTVANLGQEQSGNNVGGPYGDACVDPDVELPPDLEIGDNPIIGEGTSFEDGVVIGDNADIGSDVQFKQDVTVGDDVVLGDEVIAEYGVTLGDDVELGYKVKLEENVMIGDRVTIGDESVIKKDVVIKEDATIGTFVTIEEGAEIGVNATIGGGALVPSGTIIPDGDTFPP